jgi:hypothetical protein
LEQAIFYEETELTVNQAALEFLRSRQGCADKLRGGWQDG